MYAFGGWGPSYVGLGQAQQDATEARRRASEAEIGNIELGRRIDHLALACQALFEILSEKAGITHDELTKKMTEIDLRDGVQDGRIGPRIIQCPACGRNVSASKPKCMFCGAAIPTDAI
jgi:hypothetical protein